MFLQIGLGLGMGILMALVVGGMMTAIQALALTAPFLSGPFGLFFLLITGWILLGLFFAGILKVSVVSANDGSARLSDFLAGLKSPSLVFKVWAMFSFGLFLVFVNLAFYSNLASQDELSGAIRLLFVSLGMLVFWVGCGFTMVLLAGLPEDAPDSPPISKAIEVFLRGFRRIMIAPKAWLGTLVFGGSMGLLLVISVVGVFFLPGVILAAVTSAATVSASHERFLQQARELLGDEASLEKIQAKAAEYWEALDAKKGRRNLRQILRPWEE
jgi:hypothetical protein